MLKSLFHGAALKLGNLNFKEQQDGDHQSQSLLVELSESELVLGPRSLLIGP